MFELKSRMHDVLDLILSDGDPAKIRNLLDEIAINAENQSGLPINDFIAIYEIYQGTKNIDDEKRIQVALSEILRLKQTLDGYKFLIANKRREAYVSNIISNLESKIKEESCCDKIYNFFCTTKKEKKICTDTTGESERSF